MTGFSMIAPCERDRIPLFINSIQKYIEFGIPDNFEIIMPTRTIDDTDGLHDIYNIKLLQYTYECQDFNPSHSLNLAVRNTIYENIIVTCPEVMPITNVLNQLSSLEKGNYACQVFDLNEDGSVRKSLVNRRFRYKTPGLYFLNLFQKEDIYKINGWDEQFMAGRGYEDTDFGYRWARAGIPFSIKEDIQAAHQWHPREYEQKGLDINKKIFLSNNELGIITPKNGIKSLI